MQHGGMLSSVTLMHQMFRPRNDLHCVGWGIELYSLTHQIYRWASTLPLQH